MVVVEDNWIDGGLGDAVAAGVSGTVPIHSLAVHKQPRSGSPAQLLEYESISARAIVRKVHEVLELGA